MRKPAWYREEEERLVKMYTRVNLTKVASVYRHMHEKFGVKANGRSELLRTVLEFTYQVLAGKEEFKPFHSAHEAFVYLDYHGLAPKEGRDYENLKKVVDSEHFDVSMGGRLVGRELKEKKDYENVEALDEAFRMQGKPEAFIEAKLRMLCEAEGVSYEEYVRRSKRNRFTSVPSAKDEVVMTEERIAQRRGDQTSGTHTTEDIYHDGEEARDPYTVLDERWETYIEKGYDDQRIRVGLTMLAKELGVSYDDYMKHTGNK